MFGVVNVLIVGTASPASAIDFRKDRLAKPRGQQPPVTRLLVQVRRGTSDASRDEIVRTPAAGARCGCVWSARSRSALARGRVSKTSGPGCAAATVCSAWRTTGRSRSRRTPTTPASASSMRSSRRMTMTSTRRAPGTSGRVREGRGARHRCADQPSRPQGQPVGEHQGPVQRPRRRGNGVVDDRFGGDVVDGKGSGEDQQGHGTHVAGIIGARGNNDRGIAGLCWSVKIVAVRVLDADGHGTWSQEIAGIDYEIGAGAKVSTPPSAGRPAQRSSARRSSEPTARACCWWPPPATTGSTPMRAGVPCRLPGQQHPLRRGHQQQRQAGLVLELRSQDRGPGRARRPHCVHRLAFRLRVHVGNEHGAPYVAAAAAMLGKAHSSWSSARSAPACARRATR